MLSVKYVEKGNKCLCYCNNCGKSYDPDEASIYKKGNVFFCSAKCVIEYDKIKDGE